MSVLTAEGLAKAYGAQDVFQDVALRIAHGERVGLVGPNGHGKTTLLKILAGREEPSQGTVARQRGLRIGYLPQDPPTANGQTLYEAMLSVFANLREQHDRLQALAQQLAHHGGDPAIVERYGELQARYEQAGGYTYEVRIAQILGGLGFAEDQFHAPLAHLSGGQRTRGLLAQLLLEEPDLLLLDEPTNHLDLHAVEWLEETLLAWKGSLVVVSHDRYFLDRVVTRIWEMINGQLQGYRGNYSAYVRQREERLARWQEEYAAQQEQIAKTEDFIRRNMAGQRTAEAKGRLKRLERFKQDEALERPPEEKRIRLSLNADYRSGDIVLRAKNLTIGYGGEKGRRLFHIDQLELRRGERAALIGPNGTGKTTFVKTILEELPPLAGTLYRGASLKVGYLAQAHTGLRPEQSVLEAVLEADPHLTISAARTLLGRYLFSGDDVHKSVGALSGGERSRVALARLTLQGANFLLLDEPTNHLDIPSQEILQDVLSDFPGTVLLVSHDRYLVRALATQVWELEQGELRAYEGGYDDYLAERSRLQLLAKEAAARQSATLTPAQQAREQSRRERQQRRAEEERQRKADALEREITRLEQRRAELEQALVQASLAADSAQVLALSAEYQDVEHTLNRQIEAWGALVDGEPLADSAAA